MPNIDPKLAANLKNLHIDTTGTPDLHVTPIPQQGGPVPDGWSTMQKTVAALQAANSALTDRVAELEKQMVAVRLVLQGVDPAFATVKKQIADFHAEYASHSHNLPFDYESFDFIQDTPGNNKPNFLMAYIWEGANQSKDQWKRQQDAQTRGTKTSPPQQNPK